MKRAIRNGHNVDVKSDGSITISDNEGNDLTFSDQYFSNKDARSSDSKFKRNMGAVFGTANDDLRRESDILRRARITVPEAKADEAANLTALAKGSG